MQLNFQYINSYISKGWSLFLLEDCFVLKLQDNLHSDEKGEWCTAVKVGLDWMDLNFVHVLN